MLMLNSAHLNDCTAYANVHVDLIRDLSKVKSWDGKCKSENLLKRWVALSLMSHSVSFTCNSSCSTVNGEVQTKVGNFLSHCPTIMDHGSHRYLFQCSWTSDFETWYRIHKAQYACILSLVALVNLLSFFPLSIENLKTVSELQAQFLLLPLQTADSWNPKARWESDSFSFARSYETPLYSLKGWMAGMISLIVYYQSLCFFIIRLHLEGPASSLLFMSRSTSHPVMSLQCSSKLSSSPLLTVLPDVPLPSKSSKLPPQNINILIVCSC